MDIPKDAMLLRIFFGEDDRFEHQPLYEAIVQKAREMHLAGATVLRGPMGFGHSSRLHTAKVLRLSFDLPIVVEIVDTEAKINEFLPILDSMMASGLITLEKVQVLQYGKEGLKRASRSSLDRTPFNREQDYDELSFGGGWRRARKHGTLLVLGLRCTSIRRMVSLGHAHRQRLRFVCHRSIRCVERNRRSILDPARAARLCDGWLCGGYTTFPRSAFKR